MYLDSPTKLASPAASHNVPLAAGTARCSSRGTSSAVRCTCGLERLGNDARGAVFFEDTSVDDTLIDTRRLKAVLGDVVTAADRLLEQTEVELSLAADIVGDWFSYLRQGVGAS